MPNYTQINDLITDLIKQSSAAGAPTAANFSSAFFSQLTDALPSEFWEKLMEYMRNEKDMGIATTPIQQATFNQDATQLVSLFNYINDQIDLSDNKINGVWATLVDAIQYDIDLTTDSGVTSGDTYYFWNESVNYLVALYLSTLDPNIAQIYLGKHDGNDVYSSVSDIKNADAAWSFTQKWVKPLKNIDELEYEQVRAQDKIESVLRNSNEMQFTHTQSKADGTDHGKWIRLIMPKYMRKVEVEDLNRNFWVIAQVLSSVCAFLFGNNSLAEILRRILNELVQLWENVLYLWATTALISQKPKYSDVHVEVVPLPNSTIQSYTKFDDFGDTAATDWVTIYARTKHIIEQYADCHVVIIPQIREDNYKHNYYSRESYPGAIVFNRNSGDVFYLDFALTDTAASPSGTIDGQSTYPLIDLKYESGLQTFTYADKIGAIKEDEINYTYWEPFSDTIANGSITSAYYALLRTVPSIYVSYDESTDVITVNSFTLHIYDVTQELNGGNRTEILTFTQDSSWNSSGKTTGQHYNVDVVYTISGSTLTPPVSDPVPFLITQGYYAGELCSYQCLLALNNYTVESEPYHGQQMLFTNPVQVKELMGETQ